MYDNQDKDALVVQLHPKPVHAVPMAEAVKSQGGNNAAPKSGCRDPFFAALFVANLGIMIYFATAHGVSGLSVDENDNSVMSSILDDVSLGAMLGAAAVVVRMGTIIFIMMFFPYLFFSQSIFLSKGAALFHLSNSFMKSSSLCTRYFLRPLFAGGGSSGRCMTQKACCSFRSRSTWSCTALLLLLPWSSGTFSSQSCAASEWFWYVHVRIFLIHYIVMLQRKALGRGALSPEIVCPLISLFNPSILLSLFLSGRLGASGVRCKIACPLPLRTSP